MDQILAGKPKEEVSKILLEEIRKGHKEAVESIINATKSSRTDRPKETAQLEQKDFRSAYDKGMKEAEQAPNRGMQDKIHRSSALLINEGKIQPQVHLNLVKENTQKLNQRLDKGVSH